jgi:hypothetical protein
MISRRPRPRNQVSLSVPVCSTAGGPPARADRKLKSTVTRAGARVRLGLRILHLALAPGPAVPMARWPGPGLSRVRY